MKRTILTLKFTFTTILIVLLVKCKTIDKTQIVSVVKPPIEGLEVNKNIFTYSPTKEKIHTTNRGSEVIIPANCLVYADGSAVTENIEIEFKEFHNMAEIALSGIPMLYEENGVPSNFISGGMFEIKGKTLEGEEVMVKEGENITVNLASNKEGNFDLFLLNEKTGKWSALNQEIKEKPIEEATALPTLPNKPNGSDVILDINISKFNGTYGFESNLWKLAGNLSEKNKKKIANTKWTKYEIKVLDEKSMLYELTVSKGLEVIKADVIPVLSPADRDKCQTKIAEEITKMQQDLTSNFYKPKVERTVKITGFGIVNCDVFEVTDQSLICNYLVEGADNNNISFVQFDLTKDMMINVPSKKLQFNRDSKNILVGLLPNQEVAIFTPSQYQEINELPKNSKVDVKFQKLSETINSAEDLQKIIVSFY